MQASKCRRSVRVSRRSRSCWVTGSISTGGTKRHADHLSAWAVRPPVIGWGYLPPSTGLRAGGNGSENHGQGQSGAGASTGGADGRPESAAVAAGTTRTRLRACKRQSGRSGFACEPSRPAVSDRSVPRPALPVLPAPDAAVFLRRAGIARRRRGNAGGGQHSGRAGAPLFPLPADAGHGPCGSGLPDAQGFRRATGRTASARKY
ncbi:hypothetical protein D9M70_550750 [compost metagenome]